MTYRWLVGSDQDEDWFLLSPVLDHQVVGEPSRQIVHQGVPFLL